jgi:hypothetical protein
VLSHHVSRSAPSLFAWRDKGGAPPRQAGTGADDAGTPPSRLLQLCGGRIPYRLIAYACDPCTALDTDRGQLHRQL